MLNIANAVFLGISISQDNGKGIIVLRVMGNVDVKALETLQWKR